MVRGVAQSGVRLANERTVLGLIAIGPGSSNADVARLSGLGAQTTSRIISELEERGLILRGQVLRGRRGQPATPLFINPNGAFCIGVEIGWRHFEVVLIDMAGVSARPVRYYYDWPDATTLLQRVAEEVVRLRDSLTNQQRAHLVGVGLATPTDIEKHVELTGAPPEQATLWRDTNIAAKLAAATGLEVEWHNDGHAATWAELIAQAHPRMRNFAYFQLGSAVGGGLVIDGGFGEGGCRPAELGSIMICDGLSAPTFIHFLAALDSLSTAVVAAGGKRPSGDPQTWDWDGLESVVEPWSDKAGEALARGIQGIRATIEIEAAVIDGPMPDHLLERVIARTNHHLTRIPVFSHQHPPAVRGRAGGSGAAVGAAQLLMFDRFFSRAWNLMAT